MPTMQTETDTKCYYGFCSDILERRLMIYVLYLCTGVICSVTVTV